MDAFGNEIIYIPNSEQYADKPVIIPRSAVCNTAYEETETAIVQKDGAYLYKVKPNITDETYNNEESILKTKVEIWKRLFGFDDRYRYNNDSHYPAVFNVYLKNKLSIQVPEDEPCKIDSFIEHVRNAVFVRTIYSCSTPLIKTASWLANGTLKLENTTKYTINNKIKSWINT